MFNEHLNLSSVSCRIIFKIRSFLLIYDLTIVTATALLSSAQIRVKREIHIICFVMMTMQKSTNLVFSSLIAINYYHLLLTLQDRMYICDTILLLYGGRRQIFACALVYLSKSSTSS